MKPRVKNVCPAAPVWTGWATCCVALLFAVSGLHAATLTATLDRNNISVGEVVALALTFEGGAPDQMPNIQLPANLSIQSNQRKQQMTIVNGRMTSSITLEFEIAASKPGDYVIPTIQVQVGNETLTSQPLPLKVTKGNAPVGMAFLKLVVDKQTVYAGEPFPVEIQLYLGTQQENLQMPQIEGDGFVFGKINPPTSGRGQIGNQIYTVGTFRLSAVAIKTGTLTLGPAQCSLTLLLRSPRNRGFFDEFFGMQRKPVTLTAEPQTIIVLPLPAENKPPTFNGAVGSFSLAVSASPTNLTAGDPITLRVQVSGRGNLESLPFPGGADWPDFKLYPPTSKVESEDPLGISGAKTFERVVIPQSADVRELPATAFSFFDPGQKAYRTLMGPSIPITVRPAAVAQPTVLATAKQAQEPAPVTRDIVHIKPYLGTVSAFQSPLLLRPWFLVLQGLPVLGWLAAVVWRKRRERLENNPRLRRRRQVAETMRQGLAELRRLAEARESDAFFATVFRLLQEQLGERLDLPASAITEAALDEHLRGRAPQELVDSLHELFQVCNQARYAPHHSSQELAALVPRVEAALQQLRQLPELTARSSATARNA